MPVCSFGAYRPEERHFLSKRLHHSECSTILSVDHTACTQYHISWPKGPRHRLLALVKTSEWGHFIQLLQLSNIWEPCRELVHFLEQRNAMNHWSLNDGFAQTAAQRHPCFIFVLNNASWLIYIGSPAGF